MWDFILSVFRRPWRKVDWEDNETTLDYLKNYNPPTPGQPIRVLLYGPVGAGKSTFINSVQSVLRGRMYRQAMMDAKSAKSFTTKYTTYTVPDGTSGSSYPFVLADTMGLERNAPTEEIIKRALRGHLRDGFQVTPDAELSEEDEFYNRFPTDSEKVHVVVCVFPMDTPYPLADETVSRIRAITEEARDLNIPQVAVLTKLDLVWSFIGWNLRSVYRRNVVKQKMEQFSAEVGIPMNCIFPVKNYSEETTPNSDVNSLILDALRNIVTVGGDHVEFIRRQTERSD